MLDRLVGALGGSLHEDGKSALPETLAETPDFMQQPVFHQYRTETEMMRYMRSLADRIWHWTDA